MIVGTCEEVRLDLNDCVYMESHVTGTKAGDPIEYRAITKACCDKSDAVLLIGAHKSNIGLHENLFRLVRFE